jgi:arginase family enzyme
MFDAVHKRTGRGRGRRLVTDEPTPASARVPRGVRTRAWPAEAIGDGRVLGAVLAHAARRWHVHLDLDVLDPVNFREVTVPTPHGTTLAAVTQLMLAVVARRALVRLTITEHVGGEPSARRVAEMIAKLRSAGWG